MAAAPGMMIEINRIAVEREALEQERSGATTLAVLREKEQRRAWRHRDHARPG